MFETNVIVIIIYIQYNIYLYNISIYLSIYVELVISA